MGGSFRQHRSIAKRSFTPRFQKILSIPFASGWRYSIIGERIFISGRGARRGERLCLKVRRLSQTRYPSFVAAASNTQVRLGLERAVKCDHSVGCAAVLV